MGYVGNEPDVGFTSFAQQTITGNGGTSYTLSHAVANGKEILLYINNIKQEEGLSKAYTASGTTLTLSEAITSSDSCYCVFLGKALQTTVPPDGSVTSAKLDTNIAVSGNLDVGTIRATNGTSAMTIDSSGNTTLSGNLTTSSFVTAKTPAFKARLSADQTINQSTWTKVSFATEVLDNKAWYDTSNYRYTPQQPGFYLFTLNLFQSQGTGNSQRRIGAISKNGTFLRVWDQEITSSAAVLTNGSILLEANGSSDYFEAYNWAQTSNASNVVLSNSDFANWSGFLVTAT